MDGTGTGADLAVEGIVHIGGKPLVERRARATGVLTLGGESLAAIRARVVAKGDVLQASTIAAIQAVKETPRIVPHCHPIPLSGTDIEWTVEEDGVRCTVDVRATWKTGVEMEALTGVAAGLLCAWDMVKSLEKDAAGQYPETAIRDIVVLEKWKDTAASGSHRQD